MVRVLFRRGHFPDVGHSTPRVVRTWVSERYTLMRREESRKQILPPISFGWGNRKGKLPAVKATP